LLALSNFLTGFIDAHKETQHELGKMWGDPDAADTPEERRVIAESQGEIEQAFVALAGIQMLHGDQLRFIENFQVAQFLFEAQREAIEELVETGACSEKIGEELLEEVQHDQDKLSKDRTVGDLVSKVRSTFRHSMAGTDSLATYTRERVAKPRINHAASCPPDPVHASTRAAKNALQAAERAGAAQAAGASIEMRKMKRIPTEVINV